jgi:TonB family C-terminal domain
MFDKLIESNSEGAEFKNRRSYFMVSSVVVGLLFLAAVVASIYAGDIGLGQDEFELSTMIAPVIPDTQPEPPRPQAQTHAALQTSESSRQVNQLRPEESPIIPRDISVVQNTHLSRPDVGRFIVDPGPERDGAGPISTGRENIGDPNGTGLSNNPAVAETREVVAPPALPKPQKPIIQTLGVVNGIAKSLPKPPYPAAALTMNVQGKVDVQVTIDENGNVIASKAVSGHPLLKAAAEKAAWSAKFTPTILSKVPVKVTGVIVYNFTRN